MVLDVAIAIDSKTKALAGLFHGDEKSSKRIKQRYGKDGKALVLRKLVRAVETATGAKQDSLCSVSDILRGKNPGRTCNLLHQLATLASAPDSVAELQSASKLATKEFETERVRVFGPIGTGQRATSD